MIASRKTVAAKCLITIMATSDGKTYYPAVRKENRADLIVYGAEGTKLEIMSPTGSGNKEGIIQSGANQLLRATCKMAQLQHGLIPDLRLGRGYLSITRRDSVEVLESMCK